MLKLSVLRPKPSQRTVAKVETKTMKHDNQFGEVVYQYTEEQAIEDGILFDLSQVNSEWKRGVINIVTVNAMVSLQCLKEDKVTGGDKLNVPNLLDVLNQSVQIIKKGKPDHFYSGKIENADGGKVKVFLQQNSSGQFTLMLPEDY